MIWPFDIYFGCFIRTLFLLHGKDGNFEGTLNFPTRTSFLFISKNKKHSKVLKLGRFELNRDELVAIKTQFKKEISEVKKPV
ncbi:hypothetical protein RchiOBHm_Chr7g0207231 [Rosa chinensis]|uniref:Uncharacterized protein n=1 Tax=Rosa chinensis TaxID=74649 RepID=A0A2P6P9D5_ROSCH|nr:hypothetical protein RchiOBHm_Chr7g0207231 [Rosa chinensis]